MELNAVKRTKAPAAFVLSASSILMSLCGCFLLDDTASGMTRGVQRELLSKGCTGETDAATCAAAIRGLDAMDKWNKKMRIVNDARCVQIISDGGESNEFVTICSAWCVDIGVTTCHDLPR